MTSVQIRCESCSNSWKLTGNWSPLVQENVESRSCPKCGSDTLCCTQAVPEKGRKLRRKPVVRRDGATR